MKTTMRAGLITALASAALMMSACSRPPQQTNNAGLGDDEQPMIGHTVPPGAVGVVIHTLGSNRGVDPEVRGNGYALVGIGDNIVDFPIIQRQYSFTAAPEKDNDAINEEIVFADQHGVSVAGDVAITLRVDPVKAPALYKKYRLTFDQLLYGPIRQDIRAFIDLESEKMPVDAMFGGGKETIIGLAKKHLQDKWAAEGIEIPSLYWIGNLRPPQVVTEAILARTQADAKVLQAASEQQVATAQGLTTVAMAEADAKAMTIRGAAIRANPQVLQQAAIDKWDGHLPTVTGGATPFVNIPTGN